MMFADHAPHGACFKFFRRKLSILTTTAIRLHIHGCNYTYTLCQGPSSVVVNNTYMGSYLGVGRRCYYHLLSGNTVFPGSCDLARSCPPMWDLWLPCPKSQFCPCHKRKNPIHSSCNFIFHPYRVRTLNLYMLTFNKGALLPSIPNIPIMSHSESIL